MRKCKKPKTPVSNVKSTPTQDLITIMTILIKVSLTKLLKINSSDLSNVIKINVKMVMLKKCNLYSPTNLKLQIKKISYFTKSTVISDVKDVKKWFLSMMTDNSIV